MADGLLVDGCLICNGRGQVAAGQACPVCGGTGVATAEQAASYRQLLVDAAVQAATERFAQAGTDAAEGILRGLAQARDDARETTARAGEVLEALKAARQSAWIAQQAALRVMGAETLVTRAETAASGIATRLAGPLPPDPTDPPPGITLPAGMGGEIFYADSLLIRQLDVWGPANIPNLVSSGFPSPITSLGDLIVGGVGGVAQRLGIGTANQVLTVSGGTAAWVNAVTGFTNPMTTVGDIIIEGAGPAPARLAIGTAGQVLTVSAGLPAWVNSPAGFANPMTTKGDLIVADVGGAALRLALGAAGQVLTIAGGTVAWQTNPAGFTNPMTTLGDMIAATTGGAAIRLPVGAAGQLLQMTGSPAAPAWSTMPFIVVPPSGDTTGAQDITNINAAFALLPNGGTVMLLAATYYIGSGGISVPPYNILQGAGHNTVINCVGTGTGTYVTVFNSANPQGYTRLSGQLLDVVVDGTSAGNGAVGVSLQDVNGYNIRLAVRGFTGTGSIGLQVANNTHSTNNLTGFARVENCTSCLQFNALGAQNALEHVYLVLNLVVNAGQNAIVLAGSVGVQGSDIIADVGVLSTSAGPVFSFGTGCVFSDTNFLVKAELTNPAVSASTVSFTGGGSGFVRTTGILFFSPNLLNSNVVAQNGQVKHFGSIQNDSSLQGAAIPPVGTGTYDQSLVSAPAFPGASGTAVTNNTGVPAWVTVAGGTLSAATVINGVNVGDVNTRVFMVPRTQSITLTWSAAPTGWVWQPVG